MKKVSVLLLIFISIFSSCSNNDEINTNVNDPIIGKWFYFSLNNEEVSDCDKKTSIEFLTSGTSITETFQVLSNKECGKSTFIESKWINKGEDIYIFNNLESKIEFSNDDKTFTITSGNIVYKKQ